MLTFIILLFYYLLDTCPQDLKGPEMAKNQKQNASAGKKKPGRPSAYPKPDLAVGDQEVYPVADGALKSMRASILGWAKRSGIELKTNFDNGHLMITRVA